MTTHSDNPMQPTLEHPTLDNLLKSLPDLFLVSHITLNRLERLAREILGQGIGHLVCVGRGTVEHGHVAACFGDGSGEGESDTSVSTGDDEVLGGRRQRSSQRGVDDLKRWEDQSARTLSLKSMEKTIVAGSGVFV